MITRLKATAGLLAFAGCIVFWIVFISVLIRGI